MLSPWKKNNSGKVSFPEFKKNLKKAIESYREPHEMSRLETLRRIKWGDDYKAFAKSLDELLLGSFLLPTDVRANGKQQSHYLTKYCEERGIRVVFNNSLNPPQVTIKM